MRCNPRKLPKIISLAGVDYKVITNPDGNGGSVDLWKHIITIGTEVPADIPEILTHEILEALLSIRNLRYALERETTESGDYLFSFNHKEYEGLAKDFAASLKGISFK